MIGSYEMERYGWVDEDGHAAFFVPRRNQPNLDLDAVEAWLIAAYGQRSAAIEGSRWWLGDGGGVWLSQMEDAVAFRMRWC